MARMYVDKVDIGTILVLLALREGSILETSLAKITLLKLHDKNNKIL